MLKDLVQDRLSALGIESIVRPQGLKKVLVSPYVIRRRSIPLAPLAEEAMVILSPSAREKVLKIAEPVRLAFIADLVFCKTALLVFAQTASWPDSLKSKLKQCPIPAAVSSLDENLLESRLKAIIREKMKKCITVHGTAMEVQGRGILVRGESGIGKTTALLQAISEGHLWIADDRVVIRKDHAGKLFVSGHRKIRNYFHTEQTGIMSVDRMVSVSQIRKKAELAFVIDVIRAPVNDSTCHYHDTEIMETRVSLIEMNIPLAGYFDKNLLLRAIEKSKRGR